MTRPGGSALLLVSIASLSSCARDGKPLPAPAFSAPVRVNDSASGTGQTEPTIAVDPSGRTVAVAWMDWSRDVPHVRLAVSTDGGASFGASRAILDPDPAHDMGQADATLAFAGGRFAIAWLACRRDEEAARQHACDLHLRTSDAGGRHWSSERAVSAGGPVLRGRPWLVADGERFVVAWTEVEPDGTKRWVLAREDADAKFHTIHRLEELAIAPPALTEAGPLALTIDRAKGEAALVSLRALSPGRPEDASTSVRLPFPPAAIPFDYSTGALAASGDGETWIAVPAGDAKRNDFVLHRRTSATRPLSAVRGLRDAGSRVALPWLIPVPSKPQRFLAAWIEEGQEGWRVRARLLGPAAAVSPAVDVSRAPFLFHEASRTRNIGDFLGAAAAGDAFWIVWSDTRDGDADVWIARGMAPG